MFQWLNHISISTSVCSLTWPYPTLSQRAFNHPPFYWKRLTRRTTNATSQAMHLRAVGRPAAGHQWPSLLTRRATVSWSDRIDATESTRATHTSRKAVVSVERPYWCNRKLSPLTYVPIWWHHPASHSLIHSTRPTHTLPFDSTKLPFHTSSSPSSLHSTRPTPFSSQPFQPTLIFVPALQAKSCQVTA